MSKRERSLVVLSIIFMLLLFPLSQVSASQPYMGGYQLYVDQYVYRVMMRVSFGMTNPSQIPTNKWLGGVTSVAGAQGITPSGWIYQNMVVLRHDSSVTWVPQAWYGSSLEEYHEWGPIGASSYWGFYERTDISSGTLTYKLYVYETSGWDGHNPAIYTWTHSTADANFIVGKQQHGSYYYKHFQFGVESNTAVSETQWEVLNDKPCFYESGYWCYNPGYVCRGSGTSSLITWIGTTPYRVGGLLYSGVNKKSAYTDTVFWKRTGSTIADNSLLWSGTGYVLDPVSKPYE